MLRRGLAHDRPVAARRLGRCSVNRAVLDQVYVDPAQGASLPLALTFRTIYRPLSLGNALQTAAPAGVHGLHLCTLAVRS